MPPDDRASAPPPPPLPPPPPPPPAGFAPPIAAWQANAAGLEALGSRGARFGASILDALVLMIPVFLLSLMVGEAGSAVVGVLYLLGAALYAPLLMMRKGPNNGQTLGKQALGLRVVHQSGEPMTFGNGLLREAVGRSLISAVTCGIYGLLDPLWCLWDPRKQCLHDKVGSTLVLQATADPRIAVTLRG